MTQWLKLHRNITVQPDIVQGDNSGSTLSPDPGPGNSNIDKEQKKKNKFRKNSTGALKAQLRTARAALAAKETELAKVIGEAQTAIHGTQEEYRAAVQKLSMAEHSRSMLASEVEILRALVKRSNAHDWLVVIASAAFGWLIGWLL